MEQKQHIVKCVAEDSIAWEVGIEAGDVLLSINGQAIVDALDFHYWATEETMELLVRKADGEEWLIDIEKDEDEPLGIDFESSLMDDYKSCSNNCVFCFIDQLPKGMRQTLYFKDDDSRLSFLQGNYITLTNMNDEAIQRIINYRLSPINLSVHTTNPDLRKRMLHNKFAGRIIEHIQKFYEAGILMNGQIVLCKGLNDGKELDRTIRDLSRFLPYMQSVSVVPVGLSKHRQGLYPLDPFTKEDAKEVLEIIHHWQEELVAKHQNHFIHAGDEFYLLAEQEVPTEDNYDGYLQLENGVGMLRLLYDEFKEAYEELDEDKDIKKEITIVTGTLALKTIQELTNKVTEKYPNITCHVYGIKNKYFGERITVSGLLTGEDIVTQLIDKPLGQKLLLPSNLLKDGEPLLLDDMTVADIERALQVPVAIVKSTGNDFIQAIIE